MAYRSLPRPSSAPDAKASTNTLFFSLIVDVSLSFLRLSFLLEIVHILSYALPFSCLKLCFFFSMRFSMFSLGLIRPKNPLVCAPYRGVCPS